jgi:DNA adenine methylase
MLYMSSKRRIAKHILPIMLEGHTGTWVEPFVGGGNLIDKVPGPSIGSDINPQVISALRVIRDHAEELPKSGLEFTEADYKILRLKPEWLGDYAGFAGFAYSYGGRWLGGWRRGGGRDYVAEAYRAAIAQQPGLQGAILLVSDYKNLAIPIEATVYLDPPYRGTKGYTDSLDYEELYDWARDLSKTGRKVFMSEYEAPPDFTEVWSMEVPSDLTGGTGTRRRVEKLFKV